MAFRSQGLTSIGTMGVGPGVWFYDTEDTLPLSAGYFNAAATSLRIGDRIMVTRYANLGKVGEAYVDSTQLTVSAVTTSTVSVV